MFDEAGAKVFRIPILERIGAQLVEFFFERGRPVSARLRSNPIRAAGVMGRPNTPAKIFLIASQGTLVT